MVTEYPGPQPIWRIFKITFNNIGKYCSTVLSIELKYLSGA